MSRVIFELNPNFKKATNSRESPYRKTYNFMKILCNCSRVVTCGYEKTDMPKTSGVPRGGLVASNPPPPRNSEDIAGVLDRMSKKNRRLDFLL